MKGEVEEGIPLAHKLSAQSRARLLCCMGDLVAEENPNDAPRLFAYAVSTEDLAACKAAGEKLVASTRAGDTGGDELDLSFDSVIGANNVEGADEDAAGTERNCLYYYRRAWIVSKGRFARAMR